MPFHRRCRGCEYVQRGQTRSLTQSSTTPPTCPWSGWAVVQLYHQRNTWTLPCEICAKTLCLQKTPSRLHQFPGFFLDLSSLPPSISLSPRTTASPGAEQEELHGCCSEVRRTHGPGSQERPDGLKFECWTEVSHYDLLPCSASAFWLSVSLHHSHEAAVAQRTCAWTALNINIFLTVVAARWIMYKYLKSQHSARWVEVFQQSRDFNSISAALKELNTWKETLIIPVLLMGREMSFHQAGCVVFFPLQLNFCAASDSGSHSPFVTRWFPPYSPARSASSWGYQSDGEEWLVDLQLTASVHVVWPAHLRTSCRCWASYKG